MRYYINMEETKITYDHKKRPTTHYRCGCNLCEKCWFDPLMETCLYAGPYSGYEEENEND